MRRRVDPGPQIGQAGAIRPSGWWHWLRQMLGQRSPLTVHTLPPPGSADAAWAQGGWALAWASRAGPHHLNQDCAGALFTPSSVAAPGAAEPPACGLAVAVADGVTGGAAGDVAALALVRHWLGAPPGADRADFLAAADGAVTDALQRITPLQGAATGAACWLAPDGTGWATRVGDCRVLLARGGADGAGPQALMHDQIGSGPDANPSHMVGFGRLGAPEWVALQALAPGDVLLLVSDGVHAVLQQADWCRALAGLRDASAPAGTPGVQALQGLVNDLLQTAVARGSEDDTTVLAACRTSAERPSAKGLVP